MQAFQDTGNPVLDSFVNVTAGKELASTAMIAIYDTIRELALKEPGGLKRRDGAGSLETFNYDGSPSLHSLGGDS